MSSPHVPRNTRRAIAPRSQTTTTVSGDRTAFAVAWKALRRAGWTSRPPRGRGNLDTRYRYVRPGKNADGVEGDDYVLGEVALVEHYNMIVAGDEIDSGITIDEPMDGDKRSEMNGPSPGGARGYRKSSDVEEESTASSGCPAGKRQVEVCNAMGTSSNEFETRETNIEVAICAVCSTGCSTDRSCDACNAFMHHFCSHDVASSLALRTADGEAIADFGDQSYCSKACYEATISTSRPPSLLSPPSHEEVRHGIVARLIARTGERLQPIQSDSGDVACGIAGLCNQDDQRERELVRQRPAKSARKVPLNTGGGALKRKSASNPPKRSAAKKSKVATTKKASKKTAEAAFKQELLLRAQVSAAKIVRANVAFSPADEDWMLRQNYREVGAAFLVGIITRYEMNHEKNADGVKVPVPQFEVRWTNTAFQAKKKHVHLIPEATAIKGIKQYVSLQKNNADFGDSWSSLCNVAPRLSNIPALTEEFEEITDKGYKELYAFRSQSELQIPFCPAEVEAIEAMTFSTTETLSEPPGLFTHPDGSTTTKLREESRPLFGHAATSSFFAFLPLSFWKQVVAFTNGHASAAGDASRHPITLNEMMKFLGILWFMQLFKKGEMRNYWRDDGESSVLPGARSTSLEIIMPWKRFLYIRKHLSVRAAVTIEEIKRDPAARIRPLITILKRRCAIHVIVGRDVAVDEASIACRSRYARHIIVYNPRKPTGKYHFKLYACCCSSTWLVLSFKLHCASELEDRLGGVMSSPEISRVAELTAESTDIRSHVIEVTAALEGSRRIVNTDNFYTSCLLLESLRTIGLYCRGTVRQTSKHFPKFTMIAADEDAERGDMKQGVCTEKHIVAASWVDGSVVNVVSNADSSEVSTVHRRIQQEQVPFPAPACVKNYNAKMQGVDRADQLRGRFSIADGHTFKRWHKKLAMSMIDIARCNAYICHELAAGKPPTCDDGSDDGRGDASASSTRDPHRLFVLSLVRELFDGSWMRWLENDKGIIYTNDETEPNMQEPAACSQDAAAPSQDASAPCVAKEAWIVLKGRSRSMRECTVCRFECRPATQKTDYCEAHRVTLCKRTYPTDKSKTHLCQNDTWTCWQKFHEFYLPQNVFTPDGNLKRSSPIYRAQAVFIKQWKDQQRISTQARRGQEQTASTMEPSTLRLQEDQ